MRGLPKAEPLEPERLSGAPCTERVWGRGEGGGGGGKELVDSHFHVRTWSPRGSLQGARGDKGTGRAVWGPRATTTPDQLSALGWVNAWIHATSAVNWGPPFGALEVGSLGLVRRLASMGSLAVW